MKTGVAVRGGLLALSLVLAVAGCGAGHKAAPPPPKHKVAKVQAPQLVSMRRTNGATWQTVIIRTDGTADVGIFIGEWSGTHHKTFRLPSDELAHIEHLVALAQRVPQAVYYGTPAPSITYTLYVRRHILQVAQGHEPRQVAGLTGILSRLIDQHA
jgi:hypothetical protein